jgi:hypothetical protein
MRYSFSSKFGVNCCPQLLVAKSYRKSCVSVFCDSRWTSSMLRYAEGGSTQAGGFFSCHRRGRGLVNDRKVTLTSQLWRTAGSRSLCATTSAPSQPSERLVPDKRGFGLGQCKGQRDSVCLSRGANPSLHNLVRSAHREYAEASPTSRTNRQRARI